jgi:hypothetical protein
LIFSTKRHCENPNRDRAAKFRFARLQPTRSEHPLLPGEAIMSDYEVKIALTGEDSSAQSAIEKTSHGIVELSKQLGDAAKQYAAGVSPMEIFTEHTHEVFAAISEMRGAAGGLMTFLGGPWGAALKAAATVVVSLYEAHEKAAEKEDAQHEAAGSLKTVISDLEQATGRANRTTAQSVRESDAAARAMMHETLQVRENTKAQLERALARQSGLMDSLNSGIPGSENVGIAVGLNALHIDGLKKRLEQENKDINELHSTMMGTRSFFIMRGVDDGFDKGAAATHRFEDAMERLRIRFESGGISAATFREQYRALKVELLATQKAMDASLRTSGSTHSAGFAKGHSTRPENGVTREAGNDDASNFIVGAADKPIAIAKSISNELIALDAKANATLKAADNAAFEEKKARWKGVADSIAGAWATSLQGMIKGTQNFRGMMLNIGNAILGEATKWIEKKASNFIAKELAQTAATITGVTTRTGVEAAGAATSAGISATSALTQIGHSAAVAAAGAYAAIAKIAYVGPILAPLAAAAALAGVIALGKSIFSAEGGMGQVPYDGAMFELHKDEMVLPASLATPMRSMLLGGGVNNNIGTPANDTGITHNHYYNIKGMDGQDVHRVLMRHHQAVAQAAEKARRNGFAPSR